jgi:hypothetical protein
MNKSAAHTAACHYKGGMNIMKITLNNGATVEVTVEYKNPQSIALSIGNTALTFCPVKRNHSPIKPIDDKFIQIITDEMFDEALLSTIRRKDAQRKRAVRLEDWCSNPRYIRSFIEQSYE